MLRATKVSLKGFTLIEAMVSLFVFLIIMLALSSTFAQYFSGYRNVKAVQKDLENAQFALNLMAKELRTSTIVSPVSPPFSVTSVVFYDYSQDKCLKYEIDSTNRRLTVAKKTVIYNNPFNPFSACSGGGFSSPVSLVNIASTTGALTGNFTVIPSDPTPGTKRLGKITTSLHISEGSKHQANIQTTSALRDYGYIGLIDD